MHKDEWTRDFKRVFVIHLFIAWKVRITQNALYGNGNRWKWVENERTLSTLAESHEQANRNSNQLNFGNLFFSSIFFSKSMLELQNSQTQRDIVVVLPPPVYLDFSINLFYVVFDNGLIEFSSSTLFFNFHFDTA